MACSKAEDLINQLIEATLKLLDFGLNIMDALRVQKLLTIRNQKIGLVSDDACLPECSLRFSLNFDLMMFNKLLRNACLRARATLNELRVCRLRYPNAPLMLEPKTKIKFRKLQRKIQEFDEAVRSDKMIARRDLRDFREISIIFSQLEHDLKLLICSLECASTMKDTVLFAAPITDVMTVLSIVLNRLERLAQKAEIDEKIAAAEQQKALQDEKAPTPAQSSSAIADQRPPANPSRTKTRSKNLLAEGKNTNRTPQQRRQDMAAMIAAASQQNIVSDREEKVRDRRRHKSTRSETTATTIQSNRSVQDRDSVVANDRRSIFNVSRHRNGHYASVDSDAVQHRNRPERSIDDQQQPLSRRQMKRFRHEFIQRWTDSARHTCAQDHRVHSTKTSTSSTDRMTNVDPEKNDQHKERSTHRSRPSSSDQSNHKEINVHSSSSASLSSTNGKKNSTRQSSSPASTPRHRSPNPTPRQSKQSRDDIECQIS